MRRAHVQDNIWHHDMILKLTCPDPLTMGWRYLDQMLVPVLSHWVAPAPVSVLLGVIMGNQSVREGYHAEGTIWYVPNYANVVKKAQQCEHYTTNDWRISR